MNRQVDVKALVSHVLRGDGVNKCRICMGDTSEGQVHLSDTVVMEGDKPITLSELLEVVTGIQVPLDGDLPTGLCTECCISARNAASFRTMCRQTSNKWHTILQLLHNLPSNDFDNEKIMYVVLNDEQIVVVLDRHNFNSNTSTLDKHLTSIDVKNRQDDNDNEKEFANEFKEIDNETRCIDVNEFSKTKLDKNASTNCMDEDVVLKTIVVKNYKCPNCDMKFRNPMKLHCHLKGSMDMERACHICGKILSRTKFVSHCLENHNREVYGCKKCPALLLTKHMYIEHIKKAHTRGSHKCVDCGRRFQTLQAFSAHMSSHKHKLCQFCDKLFRNQSCFVYHVKNCPLQGETCPEDDGTKMRVDLKCDTKTNVKVESNEEYSCDYCDKKFARKKYIAAHIQIVHLKNTHRPCAYCGKLLATAHMTEHLKKHEIDLSFTCERCGIVLKTKLGYIQHSRLHTGERPYECKICKETFSASSRRSEHMRKSHKGPDTLKHACQLCPAKFRLPYKLKKHMRTSHVNEVDEATQFECGECHEKFGSCRGLLHHSRKHQNVAFPFKKPEKSIILKVFDGSCDGDQK